ATGIEVGPGVDRQQSALFGRHVRRRSHERADVRDRRGWVDSRIARSPLIRRKQLGDPEVQDLHSLAFAPRWIADYHHVFRLQVPVDDSELMRRTESVRHVDQNADRSLLADGSLPREERVEVLTREQLHREITETTFDAILEDLDRIRMIDRTGRLRLALKAL